MQHTKIGDKHGDVSSKLDLSAFEQSLLWDFSELFCYLSTSDSDIYWYQCMCVCVKQLNSDSTESEQEVHQLYSMTHWFVSLSIE